MINDESPSLPARYHLGFLLFFNLLFECVLFLHLGGEIHRKYTKKGKKGWFVRGLQMMCCICSKINKRLLLRSVLAFCTILNITFNASFNFSSPCFLSPWTWYRGVFDTEMCSCYLETRFSMFLLMLVLSFQGFKFNVPGCLFYAPPTCVGTTLFNDTSIFCIA